MRTLSRTGDADLDELAVAFLARSDKVEHGRARRRTAMVVGSVGASIIIAVAAVLVALVIFDKEKAARVAQTRAEEQRATALHAAARSAAEQGKRLEARARLRMALEAGDSTIGRALWWRMFTRPAVVDAADRAIHLRARLQRRRTTDRRREPTPLGFT